MVNLHSHSVVFLSAFMASFLCQACVGPERSARLAHEEQERFVRLEARADDPRQEGAARFAHPILLSSAEWGRILAGIRIQLRKDSVLFTRDMEPPTEAFAPDEIVYLGRTLSETFARARPDEWVVFGMSRVLPSGLNEITTGGWFAEGTRLHLLLANYRHSVTRPAVRERLWKEPLRALAAPFYDVVQDGRQIVVQEKGMFSGLLRNTGPEIVIEYQALLNAGRNAIPPTALPAPPSAASPPGAAVDKPSPAPEAAHIPVATVEEHLRTLKRLRELDLITEEEYRQKKKAILDRF